MKYLFFFIYVSALLLSCKSNSDPLMGFKLESKEKEWKARLKTLQESKIFYEKESNNSYNSYLNIFSDSIPIGISFNYDYYVSKDSNLYTNRKLRIVVISISGDTFCGQYGDDYKMVKQYGKSIGPLKKSKVDLIKRYLIQVYGKPLISSDSIEQEFLKRNIPISKLRENISFLPPPKLSDKWKIKNMSIEFYREPQFVSDCYIDTMYDDVKIVFKMLNYDQELQMIKNELKAKLRPNDLVEIVFKQPKITKLSGLYLGKHYTFSQDLYTISRLQPEEERTITDLKFDIVYFNRFNEEIARIRDCMYSFPEYIINNRKEDVLFSVYANVSYSIEYGDLEKNAKGFEFIRKNIDNYTFQEINKNQVGNSFYGHGLVRADIKKIVFEDWSVLE